MQPSLRDVLSGLLDTERDRCSYLVKGLMAPMPWSKIMVTGGVAPEKENLEKWFAVGVYCVGMGSKLFPSDKVKAGDWKYVTDKCKECFEIIAACRK